MEHQRSDGKPPGKPPVDGNKVIPLPCYGRGSKLIPLEELPFFQYLKRQATLHGGVVVRERGHPPQKHHQSSDESSDAEHNKDTAAQERSEVLCQPSTSQSPGPQSLYLADGHRFIPLTSGPPTSCHQQTDRPSHSIQPSPPTTKQCHLVPPVKDCHGGARRKMPATSPNRGQGVSWSPKKAPEPPAKKVAFESDTLSHPYDHSSWAEFLTKGVAEDLVDDSEGDLTICSGAEAQYCDTLMFPLDLEDEVTVFNEDEAKRHELDSPSTEGKPAAAVKDEPMETEESKEPKKDEVESEGYEMIRDPRLPLAPPE
ncbi:uncharacterized protein LOC142566258 isoform X2 [Dermacentor variabilis]|uniref:uncharacterized protein LOC142566258 isoform X2 n=1 Tax=Dermacentor variabilis TaxID=34621 RepID=UPI003F5C4F66